jgi:hypothetical protein
MRKWELEELLDQVIAMPFMRHEVYEIDNLAKKYKLETLRIPPYNWQVITLIKN